MARALAIVTVLFLGSWLPVGLTANKFYRYQIGTPTTATIVRCVPLSRGGLDCHGTWNVGGRSQTGPINDVPKPGAEGSSLDVHVDDGDAYAASYVIPFSLSLAAMVTLAILFTLFSFVLIRRWVRTGQRPTIPSPTP